ncbi:MAG: hypothetical protein ACRDZX_09605 [Acidimicrobiales bacterium]
MLSAYCPAVVVSAASRALRRQLRPLVWVALEEVALDALAEDGQLVARTSARQVAERLGVDPGDCRWRAARTPTARPSRPGARARA